MQAVSESEITKKYLVSRESYLAKKNPGARSPARIAYRVSRIALGPSDE
ncbi:unnamed protein product [marine sediment metagenome]|uniref:Uncharacterized protein n=1 Tax=marine sediment metagenome TaxID=412755 RepID=X0ZWI4_9ZZZZ